MGKPKVYYLLGLAGVENHENQRAQSVAKLFEIPMILLAFWMLFLWYMDTKNLIDRTLLMHTDFLIWGFFIFELITMTLLVKRKLRYLSTNWMNLLIVILGTSIIWGEMHYIAALRTGRLLLILILYLSVFDSVLEVLAKKRLSLTITICFVFIFVAGIIISVFDPAIHDPWEGLWWAWVTVTTVGYGDVVPSSVLGKVLAGFLILMGVGLFSMLTAAFSAFLVSKNATEMEGKEDDALQLLKKIDRNMTLIQQRLSALEEQNTQKSHLSASDKQLPHQNQERG